MKDYSEYEQGLKSKHNKSEKKEKKRIQDKDRSKYKSSDQKKNAKKIVAEGTRGRVLSVSSTEVIVDLDGEPTACSLRGILKKQRGPNKNVLAIGDFVIVDDRGQVASIEERYSLLARRDNLRRRHAQIIAANIDQVLIVASVKEPGLKTSLIDRYIISALRGNMTPVLIINKIDLSNDKQNLVTIIEMYRAIGIEVIDVSALEKSGIGRVVDIMKDKASVFSGQSGVGKTTLINEIAGTDYKTCEIVERTQKGVHTTSQSKLIKLDSNSFCIDTPGIKSFSLWDITSSEISNYFSDLQQYSTECKFINCTHTHEPDCGVKKAVDDGLIAKTRYESYITIREGNDEDQKHHWE